MTIEQQLAKQLEAALVKALQPKSGVQSQIEAASEKEAISEVHNEEKFYKGQVHIQHIADMQSARQQREKYARWVFVLVAGWIVALFLILIAQGACPAWRPFSDKVLIALITSMTVNLIGTLYIVLKYIFRSDL
jgi:uncharacterized membrane protein YhdT